MAKNNDTEEIAVYVVRYANRENLVMRYVDPVTRRQVTKSTGTADEKKAQRAAGEWQASLRDGRYIKPSKATWEEFRRRYTSEMLPSLSRNTAIKVNGVFNLIERKVNPQRLRDMDANRISEFQQKLREGGRSEYTIKSYLAHLRAALQWAVKMNMLAAVPQISKPERTKGKGKKGRSVTLEEFERMLAKVPAALFPKPNETGQRGDAENDQTSLASDAPEMTPEELATREADCESWRHLLRGLWLSGLRLGEAINLSWDWEAKFYVDLRNEYPVLEIPETAQKSKEDTSLPVTPDFGEFLLAVPDEDRNGRVFCPKLHGKPVGMSAACRIISDIGRLARVKVGSERTKLLRKTGETVSVVKFASAHDLRRSFATRWAVRVMPEVLRRLMRHKTIETTMKFYVDQETQAVSAAIWKDWGGNRGPRAAGAGRVDSTDSVKQEG